ncbi:MAG: hypothetical protein KIS88_04140 [Anaerolineales bacterium]|nr:hypothetical protein [Anaerolineales bacterium]
MSNERTKMLIKLAVGALAVWLTLSSLGPSLNYRRLTLALLLLWLCVIWLKQYVEQARGSAGGWLGWGLNSLLAIIPGTILTWYSLFTPAVPSVNNMGVDICQYAVGWCVSGNRAVAPWGILALLAGVAWSYFAFTSKKDVSDG